MAPFVSQKLKNAQKCHVCLQKIEAISVYQEP